MKNYWIINIPSGRFQGDWIYLVGAMSAFDMVDTVSDEDKKNEYRIKRFRLDYTLGMDGNRNLFETETYHVLVIGRLKKNNITKGKEDIIEVHAMYDSPDVTGIGIVNYKGEIELPAYNGCGLPYPFLYFPSRYVKVPANVDKMLTPTLFYNKMDRLIFPSREGIMQSEGKDIYSIEIVLPDHRGYDKNAPAFYIGAYKNMQSGRNQSKNIWSKKIDPIKKDKISLIFRGEQVCRRV